MGENGQLSAKQRRAIAALLTERTIEQAAIKSEVGYTTIRRWLREEPFAAELRLAQSDLLNQAVNTLAAAQADSLATLEELRDTAQTDSVRLAAAKTLLELFFRYKETADFETRLQALEHAQSSQST